MLNPFYDLLQYYTNTAHDAFLVYAGLTTNANTTPRFMTLRTPAHPPPAVSTTTTPAPSPCDATHTIYTTQQTIF